MRATLPPARYSADPDDDLGFANYQNAKAEFDGLQPVVYLDGEQLRHAVSADEVESVVVVINDPIKILGDGRVATTALRGRVHVRWVRPNKAHGALG